MFAAAADGLLLICIMCVCVRVCVAIKFNAYSECDSWQRDRLEHGRLMQRGKSLADIVEA